MKNPESMAELADLTLQNTRYSGFGAETTIHFPCAFCAAPDCSAASILEVEVAMQRGGTCSACGRSWRAIFTLPGLGSTHFEIVQCGGEDPPDWFQPRMRRVEPLEPGGFSRTDCRFAQCPNPQACRADNACASPDPLKGAARA